MGSHGLEAIKAVLVERKIRSVAVPPLGCGNGALQWGVVRPIIEAALADLPDVEVTVYEPTAKYQNVAKRQGVAALTPARAMIAEAVRHYWVLGVDCTLLETQKLAWFLERSIRRLGLEDPLDLKFDANRYGPYANRLMHLLNGLDGSYLHCDKRLADAAPFDTIWFDESKRELVRRYLQSKEAREYVPALEATDAIIDGFQSPLGMEVLATVDWLILKEGAAPTLPGVRDALSRWPADRSAVERKIRIFSDRLLDLALQRLKEAGAVQ